MNDTDDRNVILVTVDSLRADYCGFLGYPRDITPTLDRIAADGLTFENAVAPGPSTTQSVPAMFTGIDPVKRDVDSQSGFEGRRQHFAPHLQARDTIPEWLSRQGYTTGGFTPNPYTSRYLGFDEGFDYFEDFITDSRSSVYDRLFSGFVQDSTTLTLSRMFMNWIQREEVFKPWEAYYGLLDEWLARAPEPYFLWIHLMDPHFPFLVGREYRTQSALDMYRANWEFWEKIREGGTLTSEQHRRVVTAYEDTVRYTDAFVEQLYTRVADDDPVFIVHSDHGEGFGEHGEYGHGSDLYQENIHVPFVVGGVESETVESPVTLRDMPTLIDTLRVGGSPANLQRVVASSSTLGCDNVAVVGDSWKYLSRSGNGQLYDISEGDEVSFEHEELERLGRTLVAQRVASDRECERLVEGVSSIGDRL